MPKGKRAANAQVVRETGTIYFTASASSSIASLFINPDSMGTYSSKLQQLSDCFELYRFTKLTLHIPAMGAAEGVSAVGFSTMVSTATPSTLAGVMDMPWSWLIRQQGSASTTTVPVQRSINRKDLVQTAAKWFRTRPSGSFDDNLEYQGYLMIFATAASASVAFALTWSCEFCQFVAPAQTPMRNVKRTEDDEETKSDGDLTVVTSVDALAREDLVRLVRKLAPKPP